MRTLNGAIAVVTGAGSGIGRALALDLGRRGCALALADVDEAGLAGTRALLDPATPVSTTRVDVSKLDEMTAFRDEVERTFGRVSLLVNNAGVSLYGTFAQVSLEDIAWVMNINFWGPVYGCKLFLPLLLREPEANIVTISSLFGLIAPPMQTGYSAAKFAVRGFSETLRHELAPTNVRLTVVHPGGIKTQIAARSRRGEAADPKRHERDTKGFERGLVLPPENAARQIVEAVLADKGRLLIGRDAVLADIVQRFFPARYMDVLGPMLDPKKRFRRAREQASLRS
jgi:NAD(P)-dependent dehydrogenase (short-subunit alcohol dehydrogenase family)